MTESEQMKLWAQEEAKRLSDERSQKMKEKGYNEFYVWRKGENKFEIDITKPKREIEGTYGKQVIFVAKSGDIIYDLAVNVRSPVYRIIVKGLAEGKTSFNILKSGEGKDVRYEELKE